MAENIRLTEIAKMVHKGMITADIGTDHAFLPIYLVQHNICNRVYACDIAEGPLKSARENVASVGMQDRIPLILSDGLKNVPEDVNCIVIAGMGFKTAEGILERDFHRLRDFDQIIVEVNRDTIDMRNWIKEKKFFIQDEVYVYDRGHDYVTIAFDTHKSSDYSYSDIILGPVLFLKKEQAYYDYLRRRRDKIKNIIALSHGHAKKQYELQKELDLLNTVL